MTEECLSCEYNEYCLGSEVCDCLCHDDEFIDYPFDVGE